MKELTMFDISNPLDDEQMMEIDGGHCVCRCIGDDQVMFPGWSNSSDNGSANSASNFESPDPSICRCTGPQASYIAEAIDMGV